jgi:osmoprotectant transport system ATP-binding protein
VEHVSHQGPSTPSPALTFERVTVVRASGHRALDEVSFAVPTGRSVAIVGRSGAGKSTLLRLVNGLLRPTLGEVRVDGRATAAWDPIALRRHVGYVLQDVGLFPHMTVAQNLALLPRLAGWPARRVQSRVDELLRLVELAPAEFRDRFPSELSGGQRQRVGVARALVLDPPILLMDEPFGALDPVTRLQLHREFWRIQARLRRTVLIVTHDLREALDLGEDLGVVDDGRLIAFGSAADVARSGDPRVRILVETLSPAMSGTSPPGAPS